MNEIVDLDDLVPPSVTIKLDGVDIEIPPPTTVNLLQLAAYSQAMAAEKIDKLSEAELAAAVDQLTQQIYKMVPAINGKPLNLSQLQKLVEILTRMGMPKEAEELEAKGISPATPKTNP